MLLLCHFICNTFPLIQPLQDTTVKVGSPFQIELSFTNPLNQVLTDVAFTIEGAGMRQRTIREGR